jgi:hypothetical protein
MFHLFGILSPPLGRSVASDEAPFKKSFFGAPVDAVAAPEAEQDALYLAGKCPEPVRRRPDRLPRHS